MSSRCPDFNTSRDIARALLPSGYVSELGEECTGCGKCAKKCQFEAIEMRRSSEGGTKKRAVLLADKCYGCGVCETMCDQVNITMKRDPSKGEPLDIEALA